MSDRNDIIQLINLYGFAMDTQRWDLFDRIFASDVDADYGATSHWTDLASFKRDFGSFHEVFDATQHVMTNHLVTVKGDSACTTPMERPARRAARRLPPTTAAENAPKSAARLGALWNRLQSAADKDTSITRRNSETGPNSNRNGKKRKR